MKFSAPMKLFIFFFLFSLFFVAILFWWMCSLVWLLEMLLPSWGSFLVLRPQLTSFDPRLKPLQDVIVNEDHGQKLGPPRRFKNGNEGFKNPARRGRRPRLTNYLNGKSKAEQIKARYQMKLVANMRINYWLFNLLKSSSKISESSDRNTLNMKIVNSGLLTYWKMLTWPRRPLIVNIKRRISYMDPVQKYHSKVLR